MCMLGTDVLLIFWSAALTGLLSRMSVVTALCITVLEMASLRYRAPTPESSQLVMFSLRRVLAEEDGGEGKFNRWYLRGVECCAQATKIDGDEPGNISLFSSHTQHASLPLSYHTFAPPLPRTRPCPFSCLL